MKQTNREIIMCRDNRKLEIKLNLVQINYTLLIECWIKI